MSSLNGNNEIINPTLARMFDERLRRIVEESYEVAFILCNKEMEEFNSSKLFDIFTQVFTTGYVLNTGYWPFFSTINGQCLCVCGRFGVPCRHVKNGNHWIDLQPIETEANGIVFYPKLYGQLNIQDYEVVVKPLDGSGGYHINVVLNIHYKRAEKNRTKKDKNCRTVKDMGYKIFPISIFSRFFMMTQFYSSSFTIVFQPNPFFNEHYGTHFKKLINLRAQEFNFFHGDQRQIWCIPYNQMPSTTFVHHQVNVPIYKFPSQLLVFNPCMIKPKNPPMRNKCIQTQTDRSNAWNNYYSRSPIRDSLMSFASSSFQFARPECDDFIVIDDSEEFDNQWPSVGYNKVIQPNPLLLDCADELAVKSEPQDPGAKQPYANWSPKTEPDSTVSDTFSNGASDQNYPILVSNAIDVEEKIDCKDENWFEKNFPPLRNVPVRAMNKREVDEEFEIIQTVIKDDVLKQEGNLDWWHKNIKN
ncbi:unnamed protein product [Phyllotreta striolata]|uniref:SWIM-type domain-containing protein n=1 Tax=Phyllotreta striolata TaxID=444603 RepID=A0A9N9TZG4_PHYSR|nr:unnamed protein product [Phyllotreta striolata]